MAAFSQGELDELRGRIDIVEIIGAQVRLRKAGRNFVGLCPFHQEKTPSFSVNRERGFFYCFGCQVGGTAFDFLMKTEGLNFAEAVRSLAKRCGVSLHERERNGPEETARQSMQDAAGVASEFFAHVLWNTPAGGVAREYLKNRGITAETAREFRLGFAPASSSSLATALAKRGLADAGVRIGAIKRDGAELYDMFRARLMFPIRDGQGRTIAFGGRVLDARLPKYINSPESPLYSKARNLYGLFEARAAIARADRAIVVEGYIDAIALWQAGFKETVATLGTALTVEQLRLLARHTRNVLACFDGDSAGKAASLRALGVFLEAGLLGKGIFIPTGFDPDTLIAQRGAAEFQKLIDDAKLLVDYFIENEAGSAKGSLMAQARAAERVAEMLRQVNNPFEFDLLARRAADALGVSEEILRREGRRPRSMGRAARETAAHGVQGVRDAAAEAEIGLLAMAIGHPELRAEIRLHAGRVEAEAPKELIEELCEVGAAGAEFQAAIAQRLNDDQRSHLSELMVAETIDDAGRARALVHAYGRALERRERTRKTAQLARSASEASESSEGAADAQEIIALRREAEKI
jgi:DNA primase